MTLLLFHPGGPLPEPPAGCPDPDLWLRSYELIVRHQPGDHRHCHCGELWPCLTLVTAVRSLMRACGLPVAHVLPAPGAEDPQ